MERILIRHLTGSKANQIEEFPVENFKELLLGREQSASVTFDPEKDDLVSRRHALIQVHKDGKLSFTILDLNSSNGTFVNGTRISRESELLPEDVIELGSSGPRLVFDIEPRPAHFAARTRTMPRTDPPTRVSETAVTGNTASTVMPPKLGLGRETVERLISQERRMASQLWIYGLAAMLAVIGVVGGILYYHNAIVEKRLQARAIATESQLREKVGPMTLKDIAAKYGDATILINTTWRLYHKKSGKQVYHKFINRAPAYVKLKKDGTIVRWLVTDDEKQSNQPIYKYGTGSGIVLVHDGFILTNKHVAAGWLTPYEWAENYEKHCGMCGRLYNEDSRESDAGEPFNPRSTDSLFWWRPGQEGYLFKEKKAEIIDSGSEPEGTPPPFESRGESLDVQFPGQADRIQARLIRHSDDADLALVKIDIPYDLGTTARLADAMKVPAVGEKIAILGYPEVSQKTQATFLSFERGQPQFRRVDIPAPTVTEGVISGIGREASQVERRALSFMFGSAGDVYQLSGSGVGQGNSGGPIINSYGEVIGIFTYQLTNADGDKVFFAVPIKYGRDLLQLQGKLGK